MRRSTSRMPLLAAITAMAGCLDSTGTSSGDVEITLTAAVSPMRVVPDDDNWPRASCEINFHATASAGSGAATWTGLKVRWFDGFDRTAPVDSFTVAAETVHDGWGTDSIASGTAQQSPWQFLGPLPFEAEFEFEYESGDRTRTAATRGTCGPVPVGQEPLPAAPTFGAIENVGSYKPGDQATIGFTASSAASAGLWASVLRVSGSFERTIIHGIPGGKNVSHTFTLPIPARAHAVPADLDLFVFDAFGREAVSQATLGAIADLAPPALGVNISLIGTTFIGDVERLSFEASDANGLRSITWEASPGGYRDSLLATSDSIRAIVGIPVQPEWMNEDVELRITARDMAGRATTVTVSSAPDYVVLPAYTRPTQTMTVPGLVDEAIDYARHRAYLLTSSVNSSTERTANVVVVNLHNMAILRSIPVPVLNNAPASLDLSASGDTLLVGPANDSLGVIDLRDLAVASMKRVGITAYDGIENGVAYRFAYLSPTTILMTGRAGATPFAEMSLTTGAQAVRSDGSIMGMPVKAIVRSLDRSTFAMHRSTEGATSPCVQPRDGATGLFGQCIATPVDVRPAPDLTGSRFAIGPRIYDAAFNLVRIVDLPEGSVSEQASALTPDGEFLHHFMQDGGAIRSRVSDGALIDRTNTVTDGRIRMWPDGSHMVVVGHGSPLVPRRISVVDLRQSAATPAPPAEPPTPMIAVLRTIAPERPAAAPRLIFRRKTAIPH